MPYTIKKEHHGKGVHKQFTGFITADEFLSSIYENHRDPDYDSLRYSINDFSEVTGHAVDDDHVTLATAHGLGAAFSNSDVAVAIVTTDSSIRALASMFADRTNYKVAYFDTLEHARLWVAETQRLQQP